MQRILEVKDLSINFYLREGVVHALTDVNFEVYENETLGVIGESGSGKSVTVQSILGILSQPPAKIVSGSIRFEPEARNLELNSLPTYGDVYRNVRWNDISMIFQEPMSSFSPLHSIGDQISEALTLHRQELSEADVLSVCLGLLEKVGIPSPAMFFKRYPHEFSGGMRQRAMIAMALVCNPKILIADEPTTALDVTIEAQILELLESIKSEFNMSMIYISHDLAVIGEISDRILVMYLGRVVESGLADEVIDNPLHPYTRALLKSIPKIDQPIESLEPIEGSIPSPFEVHTGCPFYSRCTERLGEICLRQKPDNKTYKNGHTVSCHLHA